jgi:hypothetical protein
VSPGIDPDYVDVATRISEFKDTYPDGVLRTGSPPQLFHVGEKTYVAYHALAYRSPKDELPGEGWAWEPVPGPTPFTRDSELMNAETAAWGRAIVALGFKTKKIATAEDVQKSQEREAERQSQFQPPPTARGLEKPSKEQYAKLNATFKDLTDKYPPSNGQKSWKEDAQAWTYEQFGVHSAKDLTKEQMSKLIDHVVKVGEAQEMPV